MHEIFRQIFQHHSNDFCCFFCIRKSLEFFRLFVFEVWILNCEANSNVFIFLMGENYFQINFGKHQANTHVANKKIAGESMRKVFVRHFLWQKSRKYLLYNSVNFLINFCLFWAIITISGMKTLRKETLHKIKSSWFDFLFRNSTHSAGKLFSRSSTNLWMKKKKKTLKAIFYAYTSAWTH